MSLNQRQVKDLVFVDIAAAKASGRPNEICYVQSLNTYFEYVVAGSTYTADDIYVLTTGNGGDTRWVARGGQNALREAGITLKEITTPTALADYGKVYTKNDNHFYIQDGAGNERPILLSGQDIAEMYLYANTTVSVIDTADAWHLLSLTEITPGELDGWTFEDGTRGTDITGYETYDGGASTLVTTTAPHNLSAGDYISITGTTTYNSIFKVLSAPSGTTFEINKSWGVNDGAVGTYNRGGTLTCGTDAGGFYKISWNVTVTPETNGHIFTGVYVVNGVPCEKCRSREKLGTAADYSNLGANSLRKAVPGPIAAGDKIQFAFKNIGNAGNFTGRHGNLNMYKV